MAGNAALRWLDGRGWLALAGDAPASDAIRARALGVAAADGGVAVVALRGADTDAEQLLADIEDLGAQAGYLVDLLAEDDTTIRAKLAEASVIVISADVDVHEVRSVLTGVAIEGIQIAFESGAVVLAEGPGAAAFGTWLVGKSGEIVAGFGWLENALIVPGATSVSESPVAQEVMRVRPAALALGIGAESALALGPDGQVELWGEQQVAIALGPDFGA